MVEIERKFLVNTQKWQPTGTGKKVKQGYLSIDPERVVRVRISGEEAFLTIKGKAEGIARTELEYKIPLNEAEVLLTMCIGFLVEKTRYVEVIENNRWEIDVFEEKNRGLVMAEIELEQVTQKVGLPVWIEYEVSEDSRYYNSFLSQKPFATW